MCKMAKRPHSEVSEDADAASKMTKRQNSEVSDDADTISNVPEAFRSRLRTTAVFATIPQAEAENSAWKFIGTHHGTFHCDEVMAVMMLKHLPEYRDLPIVRTRDPKTLAKATIVVDVGGEYDSERLRFDHHQREFKTTYSEEYALIKLSSAGLVFKHFGKEVVRAVCAPTELSPHHVEVLVAKLYDGLIREIDAIDNGVNIAEGELRYRNTSGLSSRVSRLNPSWQEEQSPEKENAAFKRALQICAEELYSALLGQAREWLPARSIVEEARELAAEVHSSQEILQLSRFCPWKEHLFDLEEEAGELGKAKYVIFQDSRGPWRVQAVGKERGGFENRKSLPKDWCGLRDEALSEKSGIPNCIFVHASGFIGGNADEAGARAMAVKALDM